MGQCFKIGATAPAAVIAGLLAVLAGGCKRKEGAAPVPAGPCVGSDACGPGRYCSFSPALCGRGPTPGSCKLRPASCPGTYAPACGCDGKVYDDECAAHLAGVDLDVTGRCETVIPDWAPCGPRYCDARTSYCEIYLSDVFEIPTTYTCRPLPAACRPLERDAGTGRDGAAPRDAGADAGSSPKCSCFPADTPCLSFCGPLPTGGLTAFHLTCQGVKEPKR